MAENVYAPLPASEERLGVHTEDHCVVSPLHATWPARCVVCNRADGLQPATFRPRYVSFWWWIVAPGLAVWMVLLPSTRVRILGSVCATHARGRNGARWTAGILSAVAFAALFVTHGEFVAVGLFVVAALAMLFPGAHPVRVAEIKGERGWFLVGDAFHASLPARETSRPSLDLDAS